MIACQVYQHYQAKHGFSIDQQIANNIQFAVQNDYAILQTFKDEGRSAKNLERPGLQDMLKFCADKKNNVEAVIVWKLDRISKINIALLKLSIYEIIYTDVPYKVAINEAVELAKKYGEDKSKNFVNGILASIVKDM